MAKILPFQAIRPETGLEKRIAALPYDVYSRAEALSEVEKEPLSFLKIDRAETQFPPDIDMYADTVYQRARDTLWRMIAQGCFIREDKPCYYMYELTAFGRSQTGIAAIAGVDDYLDGVIRKHENTREEKEQDRIRHVDICNAHTGPVFLAYRARAEISSIVEHQKRRTSLYDFFSDDGVRHRLWKICDDEAITTLCRSFSEMREIYIADGHHRCASAVRVALKRREQNTDYTGEEGFNYFLALLFPDEELKILDYNRVVKDLNGLTEEELLAGISDRFTVESRGMDYYKPEGKGIFGMYLGNCWYKLSADPQICSRDPVKGLDVSILQDYLLEPLLGIKDPKTDKRIDFVGGIRGMEELERRVHSDCSAAFSLYPTSMRELFEVADEGLLMPPKSTWFEPKPRSGLLIHEMEIVEEQYQGESCKKKF